MEDKIIGSTFKLHKILNLINTFENENKIQYDNFIITRPDIIFTKQLLVSDFDLENQIPCWFRLIMFISRKNIKILHKNLLIMKNKNASDNKFSPENRENELYKNCGFRIKSLYPTCSYQLMRISSKISEKRGKKFLNFMELYSEEDKQFFRKNILPENLKDY